MWLVETACIEVRVSTVLVSVVFNPSRPAMKSSTWSVRTRDRRSWSVQGSCPDIGLTGSVLDGEVSLSMKIVHGILSTAVSFYQDGSVFWWHWQPSWDRQQCRSYITVTTFYKFHPLWLQIEVGCCHTIAVYFKRRDLTWTMIVLVIVTSLTHCLKCNSF